MAQPWLSLFSHDLQASIALLAFLLLKKASLVLLADSCPIYWSGLGVCGACDPKPRVPWRVPTLANRALDVFGYVKSIT